MNILGSNDKSIIRICVDSTPDGGKTGRIAAAYLEQEMRFADVSEMLLLIEAYLDATGMVPSFQRGRSFGATRKVEVTEQINEAASSATGTLMTCAIRVTTRQNSTWQGYADFGDERGGVFFASALELMFMLDEQVKKLG